MAQLLSPFSHLYGAGVHLKSIITPSRNVGAPVICIGNLVAGGAGKTPTALAVAAMLRRAGRHPHFLSRGYGGRASGPLEVAAGRHDAREVGDEALLLAASAPTWVSRDRVAGAEAAIEAGADCVIMDDGFQNHALQKNLSLLVVDAGYGFGNGRLLPAGPLREPVAAGLGRSDAIVLVEAPLDPLGDGTGRPAWLPVELPMFRARLIPTEESEQFRGRRVFAFAGIGRPEKFFDTLIALGAELVDGQPFADHHRYDEAEIMALVEAAHAQGAELVTTAKDFVRLPDEARTMVKVLEVTLSLEAPERLASLLERCFQDG